MFRPKLAGPFHEILTIENLHDASNSQEISLKATVASRKHFFLQSLHLDLGFVLHSTRSRPRRIILSNTSKKRRSFEIRLDSDPERPAVFAAYFRLEEASPVVLSDADREKIAQFQHRIKILARKVCRFFCLLFSLSIYLFIYLSIYLSILQIK